MAAEYAVMTGMIIVIQQHIEESGSKDVIACLNTLKSAATSARNLINLIDQLIEETEYTESSVDLEAMRHLLVTGNKAARRYP